MMFHISCLEKFITLSLKKSKVTLSVNTKICSSGTAFHFTIRGLKSNTSMGKKNTQVLI